MLLVKQSIIDNLMLSVKSCKASSMSWVKLTRGTILLSLLFIISLYFFQLIHWEIGGGGCETGESVIFSNTGS